MSKYLDILYMVKVKLFPWIKFNIWYFNGSESKTITKRKKRNRKIWNTIL